MMPFDTSNKYSSNEQSSNNLQKTQIFPERKTFSFQKDPIILRSEEFQ